jgi:hypothetical protein
MKVSFCLVFLYISVLCFSADKADSTRSKLKAGVTFSLNSNGIASIPSFSLDKPAITVAPAFSKGRFSYEPVLAYGLNFKPWIIDNWIHYKLIDRPGFQLRTGMDISMFFSEKELQDETIFQGQRYYTFELTGIFILNPQSFVSVAYWNDRGQDEGTLKGHFFSLVGERSEIKTGDRVILSANLNLFYIDYNGNNDGLFISPKISSSMKNVPFSLFLQAIQPILSNISPYPGFRWNLGLAYSL